MLGIFEMHGEEGRSGNLSRDVDEFTNRAKHNDNYIVRGHRCLVQNDQYELDKAKVIAVAESSTSSRKVAKIKQLVEATSRPNSKIKLAIKNIDSVAGSKRNRGRAATS